MLEVWPEETNQRIDNDSDSQSILQQHGDSFFHLLRERAKVKLPNIAAFLSDSFLSLYFQHQTISLAVTWTHA